MASTFRVATLETAFTANTTEVDAAVKRVKGEAEAVTKNAAVLEVGADTSDADKKLKDVQDLLKSVGREDIEPQVVVDALDAMADLEKLADELEDVDRKRTEAEIQADVDDALDRAAKVYDTLQEIDDLDVKPEVDPSGIDDGFNKASDGLDNFKDEAGQTGREAAASFTGEFSDATDIVQELAANAFAGFGPAGAAAGIAAAAGLGVLFTQMQNIADKINEAKEETGDLALEFRDAGSQLDQVDLPGKFAEWLVAIEDNKQAWEVWQDDAISNLDNIETALQRTGLSLGDFFEAAGSGDTSTLEEYVEKLKEVNEQLAPEGHYANVGAIQAEVNVRRDAIAGLEDQIEQQEIAEEIAYELRAAEEGVTVEQLRQADAIAQVNDALREQHDLEQTSIEATLNFEDGIASLTDKQEGWNNSLSTGDQIGRDNQRTILGLTDDLQALYDATLEQTGSQEQANAVLRTGRQRLLDSAAAAGYNASEVEALVDQVLEIPLSRGTDIYANTSDAVSGIRYVNQQLDLLDGRRVNVTVQYNAAGEQVTRVGYNSMRMASGGTVTGGVPGKDSVHILAMPGEEVIRASAASKHRSLLKAINDDALPRFAAGGTVSPAAQPVINVAPSSIGNVTARLASEDIAAIVGGLYEAFERGSAAASRARVASARSGVRR